MALLPDNEPPVRLCCMQRHWGVECPDGMVQCCICFGRFGKEELYVDHTGTKWDMCKDCGISQEAGKD